ncbi:MAG: Clp protease ClpP [Ruminococcus sp.]|nr:Clp protease ClpP [Ruminococcus sp.]
MPVLQFHSRNKQAGKMEICNQTEISADLNILGDIVSDEWGKWCDDDTCPSDISEFLKNLENVQEINLHINSGGGSVFAGIAIYNMLKRHSAKITTYIDGIAASIASVIACAGDRIVIPANGTFMVHKPSNGYFFESLNADQLRKDADTLDICQKAIVQTYMSRAKEGITEDQINDLVNKESWLVGNEAAEYFDFEVEQSVQAAACASDLYDRYQNTPESLKKSKDSTEDIVDAVLKRLQEKENAMKEEETEKIKKDLLGDLDLYGV